jgi:hypothetical protein
MTQVSTGATLACSFGSAPAVLTVNPTRTVVATTLAANIMDYVPLVNIPPFGMCLAPANPVVIAATAAALGVQTPAPCIPNTAAPWVPGNPKVMIASLPALTQRCSLNCLWGGVIQILSPGQVKANHG